MSSFFDQEYDDMTWSQVCYRLPGELAVNALKRRVNNLDTLVMFFDNVGSQPSGIKELRAHVNDVIADFTVDEVFEKFETPSHPLLFNWMDSKNKDRLKDDGQENLSHKFLFNLSDPNDVTSLNRVLDSVLEEEHPAQSQIISVLNKVSSVHFNSFLDRIMKDARPSVRVCALSVRDVHNEQLISNFQKVIALKALVKMPFPEERSIGMLDFKIFSDLRPADRMTALEKYFNQFPKYRQIKVFSPEPTDDEFQLVIFAGCIEHNDRVKKLNETYKEITELEPPASEDEEEDV